MQSLDTLSQRATRTVISRAFFVVVLVALVAWIPTLFLADAGVADLVVDALTNPLSLLLLLLLQNSQYRSDQAKDHRQDQLSGALALLLRHAAEREQDAGQRDRLLAEADELEEAAEKEDRLASAGLE